MVVDRERQASPGAFLVGSFCCLGPVLLQWRAHHLTTIGMVSNSQMKHLPPGQAESFSSKPQEMGTELVRHRMI